MLVLLAMADAPTTSASMEFPPNTSTMDFSQSVLPLLPLDDNAPEFDYTAFFQGDEADYLGDMAEDSSASNSTNVLASEHSPLQQSSVSPQPPAQVVKSNAQPKQRLERRGHTKSRRGCYNCKRRRIKVLLVLPMLTTAVCASTDCGSSVKRRSRRAATVSRRA